MHRRDLRFAQRIQAEKPRSLLILLDFSRSAGAVDFSGKNA
jgi:hypothetical protein